LFPQRAALATLSYAEASHRDASRGDGSVSAAGDLPGVEVREEFEPLLALLRHRLRGPGVTDLAGRDAAPATRHPVVPGLASCVYFFHQSHLSRHFKQLVGVTPVADARCLQYKTAPRPGGR
jgi:hypothetical protein